MELEIYRIVEKTGSGFEQEEVCRACAKEEIEKGFEVEFDNHLSKYIHNDNGVSYYSDGESDEEISCSLCDGSFKGFDNGILKIEAKAESSDEAIQIAYDIFGHKVTTWDFKWD